MTLQIEHENFSLLSDFIFERYADNAFACHVGKEAITYQEAQQKVHELQAMLSKVGFSHGDKIALCSENMPNWGIVYLAVIGMGAVVVPILPEFHSNEIHHIIKHSGVKALFASRKLCAKLDEEDFSSRLAYVFELETFELVEDKTPTHSDLYIKATSAIQEMKEQAIQFAKDKKLMPKTSDQNAIKADHLAVIIYTSGTTGQSKGVMLTHHNLLAQLAQANILVKIKPQDKFLSILPLAHTFECSIGFLTPFSNGASIHYINRIPSPKIILKAMQQVKPTYMISVPLIIEKIYKNQVLPEMNKNKILSYLYNNIGFARKLLNKSAGKKLLQSFGGEIKFFGIGGAKLPEYVEQFLIEARFPYAIGYGLTETAPLIAGAVVGKTKLGTTGPFVADIEHKFVKQNETDKEGELHVRGPNVMQGYFKEHNQTEAVLDSDGWLNTGDLGYIDDKGILTISGRSKSVIVGPSGENIYPEAIESVIDKHPLVSESMVFEKNKKLVAKIYIDYDKFDEQYQMGTNSDSDMHQELLILLEEIKKSSNLALSSYCKLHSVIEQREPFIKTPTKKIKRYLYQ